MLGISRHVAVKRKIKRFAYVSILFTFSILSCFKECMKRMKEPKSNTFCTLFFRTERKQLEALFQLLKEQQDKFHVNSMEELEDQLRLYRR
jgi:hypothetical protein